MAKHVGNDRKRTTKGSARRDANYVRANVDGRTKHARSDRPPAPTGKPVMTKTKASRSASKANPLASFAKTTMGKWACALVALVLVVGVGNAISGTDVSSDATTHALVATGDTSQGSAIAAVDEAVEEAAKAAAKAGADAKAEAENQAKAKAEEEAAAAAVEAEVKVKAEREAKAQVQQEQAQRAAAPAATATQTPRASENNAARSSGGGDSSAAALAPSSGGGMVYIAASGNGTTYHSRPKCGTMKESIEISLSEAQSRGLPPCKNCYH